jgi:cytochrome c-type biogenesis protein CcmH
MNSLRTLIFVALAWMGACGIASADEAKPTALDPVSAKRAVELAAELRCLVCQNQSIAESNAELAKDLRRQIDEQIQRGRSDKEIIDYMVERYGDFVLYRPPFKVQTVLLWLGPALLAIAGFGLLGRTLRERRRRAQPAALTVAERAEAERLLDPGATQRPSGASVKDPT